MTYSIRWRERLQEPRFIKVRKRAMKRLGDYGQLARADVEREFHSVASTEQGVSCALIAKNAMKGLSLYRVQCSRVGGAGDEEDIAVVDFNPIRKVWYASFPCMMPDCQKAIEEHAGYACVQATHTDTAQTLGKFGPSIILYVSLEGYPNGKVGCHCSYHRDDMEAKDVVKLLKDDGLDSSVAEIRLWVCHGAEKMGRAESFLEEFARHAKAEFANTVFQAYDGLLTITSRGKFSYADASSPRTPARTHKHKA